MADTLTNPMHVEVISPDGPIYRETGVEMVVARAADGEFAVMKNHLPLAAALEMCPVRIIKGGKEQKVAVFGGFLEIKDNQVNIVAPLAELADTRLTSVHHPTDKLGARAAENLLAVMRNRSFDGNFEFVTEIVERDSVSGPAKA